MGGIPRVCFGEQTANKGLPGEKCERVRKELKIRVLLGRLKIEAERRFQADRSSEFHISA
jgi:hypothetical protein